MVEKTLWVLLSYNESITWIENTKNYLVGDFLLFDWDPKFWFNETDTEVKVEEVSTFIWDVVGMFTTFCCNFLKAFDLARVKWCLPKVYNNAWYKYKSVDSAGYQKSKQTLWSAIETWTFFASLFGIF